MKHRETFRVRFRDTDLSGRAKPSSLIALMQECANMQMEKYGQSLDILHENGLCFIVSRLGADFYLPVRSYEELVAEAWTCPSKGYTFRRNLRLTRADGAVAAECSTLWALRDKNTGSFVRTNDFTYNFTHDEQTIPDPSRVHLPDNMSKTGCRKVGYSDTDYNMHMNNTVYPDMLCDFLPTGVFLPDNGFKPYVSHIVINYIGEARIGEELTVYSSCIPTGSGYKYFFRTNKIDGSVNVEAELHLEKQGELKL